MLWAVMWGNLLGTVLRGRKLPGCAKSENQQIDIRIVDKLMKID
jgi:hypothetical protein